MNQTSFSDLIIKFWDHIINYVWPLKFRHEGTSIIKKTCGEPKKVYKDTDRWCWKFPFFQSFDEVDIKSHTFSSTAHSFLCDDTKAIPYNIIIDTQVEFYITNPLVIYKITNDFNSTPNPIYSFVSNEVHSIILTALSKNNVKEVVTSQKMQQMINESLSHMIKEIPDNAKYQKDILIEKIIITSYDYNISLRLAQ